MSAEGVRGVLGLDLVGARLYAVACAARVQVVVGHFGHPETKREVGAILAELWILAGNADDNSAACTRLLGRLEACPEASIDDCYRRGYYAMRALGVLADAISAVGAGSSEVAANGAKAASDGAISLAGDIAFEVQQSGHQLSMPTGQSEAECHFRILEMARVPASRSVEGIRRMCAEEAWPVDPLQEIDSARGWVRVDPP